MSTKKLLTSFLLLTCFVERADGFVQHPNLDRGFAPEKVYSVGEVDQVGLFNGNLTLQVPIGSFAVGGELSYDLTLRYNSKVWDWQEALIQGSTRPQAKAAWDTNAGLGWQIHFGKLIRPSSR
jgi:hypothetical protein